MIIINTWKTVTIFLLGNIFRNIALHYKWNNKTFTTHLLSQSNRKKVVKLKLKHRNVTNFFKLVF